MGSSRRGAYAEVRKCANRQTILSLSCPEDRVVERASSRRNEVDQTDEEVYAIRADGVCGIGAVEGLVTQGRDRRVTENPSTRAPSAAFPEAFTAPPLLVSARVHPSRVSTLRARRPAAIAPNVVEGCVRAGV